jgi:RND superfamily putative drug exporter
MTQCGARWANNLVSLAAVVGAITWFSQEGHGSEALFEVAPTAAITGLRRTGRLVTSAALMLFFAFAAPGLVTGHRHQGHRDGAGRRHPDRRHAGAGAAGAGAGQPARQVELVAGRRPGEVLRVQPPPLTDERPLPQAGERDLAFSAAAADGHATPPAPRGPADEERDWLSQRG